jgi:hypothetical protein
MCIWLLEKDLFYYLLRCGQLHHLAEESTVEVAKELHSTPHEFMHWQKPGLLGSAKPTNQLFAHVWEPSNCLKVVPDALVKVFFCEVRIVGASSAYNVGPLSKTNVLKTLAHQTEQCFTVFLLCFGISSEDL